MIGIVIGVGVALLLVTGAVVAFALKTSRERKRFEKETQSNMDKSRAEDEKAYKRTVALNRQKKVENPPERSDREPEKDFGRIPRLAAEEREEISVLVKREKALGTEILDVGAGRPGSAETEYLSTGDAPKYFAVFKYREGNSEREFRMSSMVINIGRDPDASDFVISSDTYVGRNHAIIYFKQGKFFLTDLNSKNGTFVDGERLLGTRVIDNGCQIRFANTNVNFNINI